MKPFVVGLALLAALTGAPDASAQSQSGQSSSGKSQSGTSQSGQSSSQSGQSSSGQGSSSQTQTGQTGSGSSSTSGTAATHRMNRAEERATGVPAPGAGASVPRPAPTSGTAAGSAMSSGAGRVAGRAHHHRAGRHSRTLSAAAFAFPAFPPVRGRQAGMPQRRDRPATARRNSGIAASKCSAGASASTRNRPPSAGKATQ